MSDKKTEARPPQVTVAGWVTIGASALLVLGMYEAIGGLRSLDSRERMITQLENPPFSSMGLDLQEWLSLLQTVFVIAGCCAAAAGILGGFVLQRDKKARIGLSVLAVPLFLTGLFSTGIMSSLIAVSAVLLWTRPARDWFAGRAPQPVERRVAAEAPAIPPAAPPAGQAGWPPPQVVPSAEQPPPYTGFGMPPGAAQPTPYAAAPTVAGSSARPGPLVVACVITWTTTAFVAAFFGLGALVFLANPDQLADQMAREPQFDELGMTFDELRTIFLVTASIFVAWAFSAALLALLVILRMRWARPLLIISAVLCSAMTLTMAPFAMLLPLPVTIAAMVTVYLLLRADVTRWLNRR